jgi:hypothetical protein
VEERRFHVVEAVQNERELQPVGRILAPRRYASTHWKNFALKKQQVARRAACLFLS